MSAVGDPSAVRPTVADSTDIDESRLQAAELIISLSSGIHADSSPISSVPTTTSHVQVERVAGYEDGNVIVSFLSEQGYASPHYKDAQVVTEARNHDVTGEIGGMAVAEEGIVVVDMVIPGHSEGEGNIASMMIERPAIDQQNDVVMQPHDEESETCNVAEYSIMMINKMKLEEIYAANKQMIVVEPRKDGHQCGVCRRKFSKITELYKHKISHDDTSYVTGIGSQDSMLQCRPCQMTFSDPMEHEKHKLQHLDQQMHKCCICGTIFVELSNYKCHLRVHEKNAEYVCDLCPCTVFNERRKFIAHLDDHESIKGSFVQGCPLQLSCNLCGKTFPDRYLLKRHQSYYHTDKVFRCTICARSFIERSKLTRHMLIHTDQRDYQCHVCEKYFKLKHNLLAHMNIHKGRKPYKCHICRKDFVQNVSLQRHLKIHNGYAIEYEGTHEVILPAGVKL